MGRSFQAGRGFVVKVVRWTEKAARERPGVKAEKTGSRGLGASIPLALAPDPSLGLTLGSLAVCQTTLVIHLLCTPGLRLEFSFAMNGQPNISNKTI